MNWTAFTIALLVIGSIYLAAYLGSGVSTWWCIPLPLMFATVSGLAWKKRTAQ